MRWSRSSAALMALSAALMTAGSAAAALANRRADSSGGTVKSPVPRWPCASACRPLSAARRQGGKAAGGSDVVRHVRGIAEHLHADAGADVGALLGVERQGAVERQFHRGASLFGLVCKPRKLLPIEAEQKAEQFIAAECTGYRREVLARKQGDVAATEPRRLRQPQAAPGWGIVRDAGSKIDARLFALAIGDTHVLTELEDNASPRAFLVVVVGDLRGAPDHIARFHKAPSARANCSATSAR